MNRLQQLELAIADDPTDLRRYVALADQLIAERRHDEALSVLGRAVTVSPGDLTLRERLEDVELEAARHRLAAAEQWAEGEGTDEAAAQTETLRRDLERHEIMVLAKRADRYPTERQLKFDLGVRIKRMGQYAEARKYFEEAAQDDALRPAATLEIGECLQYMRQFAKALERYKEAAETAENDADCKKLALYRAGVLAEGLNQLAEAERLLAELEQLDSGYKDVTARLDKLRQIRDKS